MSDSILWSLCRWIWYFDSHKAVDENVVKTLQCLVFSGSSPSHKNDDEVLEFAWSNNKETFPCYDKHNCGIHPSTITVRVLASAQGMD